MIDPVIFTIEIGNLTFSLYWYGVLVMLGVAIATWLASVEFKRRGQDSDYIWDSLLWILPAGIIGARLWYVLNTTLGGNLRYINDPISIINIREGGLHYFGAIVFGAIAFYFYAKRMGLDIWLALDAVAPGLLIGQAVARPANFINQELYGPPTKLPWGIKISAQHRMAPWTNLLEYPEETTLFHPAFAYEMLWNFFAAGVLLILARKYKDKIKPGVIFGAWLILAGLGRNLIEFFRPDQPTFPGTGFSYSRFVAILMILAGVLLILIMYEVITFRFIPAGKDAYRIAPPLEERIEAKKAEKNIEENHQAGADDKDSEQKDLQIEGDESSEA
ncbi:MAG: prolipoprotein diacylglyceryl transferase [Chloroflexota bacterium]|nr:prolipoprotein diacylglyceryl transferase [Chloroflexota bacterium]